MAPFRAQLILTRANAIPGDSRPREGPHTAKRHNDPVREVVDGVFELGLGFVNVHLVVIDDGVVLIDTGLPRRSARIE